MNKKINLLKEPIWLLLRKVTFPASIGSLFQTFYNLVDTFFAGKISPEALSALAKSFPIYFIIIAIGVGVGAATNTLIGNSIGEKYQKRASMYVAQSLLYAVLVSLLVTFVGLIISNFRKYFINKRVFRYNILLYYFSFDTNFFEWHS